MRARTGIAAAAAVLSAAGIIGAATTAGASTNRPAAAAGSHGQGIGDHGRASIIPGDLLVSESYYIKDPGLIAGTTLLPPGSATAATAIANGVYPFVFNNDTIDASTPQGTPATAPTRSPTGSSSARARRSSRRPGFRRTSRRPVTRHRSAASTSPSSPTRPTRSARTTTSAA